MNVYTHIHTYTYIYSDIGVEVGVLKSAQCFNGRASYTRFLSEQKIRTYF